MQSDDPPFLIVGTEVSAKFKGAFCESKIKKIVKSVKCKVLLKEAPFGNITVEDSNIRGKLELNQLVEIIQGKTVQKGIIQYIKDCSTYTVVFNDGDERVLRRTQVCLKGGKHFDSAVNLDTMPLYHPDSFANSISRDNKKKVLKRKAPASSGEDDDEELDIPLSTSSPSLSRRSIRRSSSVTPLKGIASTRSATRAIAALKYGDFMTPQSKSPTPARALIFPRASSVMVSASRISALSCESRNSADGSIKSNSLSEESENESDNKFDQKGIRKKISHKLKKTLKDADSATNKAKRTEFQRQNSLTGSDRTDRKASATTNELTKKWSSAINLEIKKKATTASTLKSSFPSTSTATNAENEDSLNAVTTLSFSRVNSGLMSSFKDKSESNNALTTDSSSTSLATSSSSSYKDSSLTKREKKSKDCFSEGAESLSAGGQPDKLIDKRFLPGSVVVINEFVPPKIGGRTHLGLVVSVKEYKTHVLNSKLPQLPNLGTRQIPVRIFQSGRYHVADLDQLSTFNPVEFRKMTDISTSCLKIAFERANLYFTKNELPQSWEKKQAVGPSTSAETTKKDKEKDRKKKEKDKQKSKKTETSSENETSESEEEDNDYNERRDRFVAHFYKFQDESGNPMNRVPVLGGKEIDLYRFYDVVNRSGGHKRVTLEGRWRRVLTKLRLEDCSGATPHTVKNAYLRYFEKFESFMKHLGYSSLNGAPSSSTSSRSLRTIRAAYDIDWKKNVDKKKEKRATQDKNEALTSIQKKHHRSSSKDSTDAPLSKISRNSSSTIPVVIKTRAITPSLQSPALRSAITEAKVKAIATIKDEAMASLLSTVTAQPESHFSAHHSKPKTSGVANFNTQTIETHIDVQSKKTPKHSTLSPSDCMPSKMKREDRDFGKNRSAGKNNDPVASLVLSKVKDKRTKTLSKRESQESDLTVTSSDEETVKRLQKQQRRGSSSKEDRVKSPLGHHAVEEQDIGYSNANIFTRFYQGQKVHARHHLRFYDARIVIVKQPSLAEIAKSLVNAFKLGKITHTSCTDLESITLRNMGNELKDALKNMVNATKCFVHYLGWNSRYDEWLMLYKIRVDEKDDKASTKAVESLIPYDLPPELFAIALDWCESSEGISSLAITHTHAIDQQRLRRLSSSAAAAVGAAASARGKSSSTSSNENATSSASGTNLFLSNLSPSSHYFPSKYSTHHFTTGTKTTPSTSSCVGTSSLASASFSYNSPLSQTKSPATSNPSLNLLAVSTSSNQENLSLGQNYSSHSPRSPLQYNPHRLPSFQQSNIAKHSIDETVIKSSLSSSVKFIIPHLQYGQKSLQQLSQTSNVGNVSNVTSSSGGTSVCVVSTQNSTEQPAGLKSDASTLSHKKFHATIDVSSSNYGQTEVSDTSGLSTTNYALGKNSSTKSISTNRLNFGVISSTFSTLPANPIAEVTCSPEDKTPTHDHFQSTSQQSSSFQTQLIDIKTKTPLSSVGLSRLLLPPPLPPSTLPVSSLPMQFESLSSSTVVPYSVVVSLTASQKQLQNSLSVTTHAPSSVLHSTTEPKNLSTQLLRSESVMDVDLDVQRAVNNMAETAVVVSSSSNLHHVFNIKEDGKFIGKNRIVETLECKTTTVSHPLLGSTTTTRSESVDAVDSMLLTVRSSPLTTVSSCGAVEDFDENSSVRLTETPLNDDDECVSVASIDTKSVTLSSKNVLSSPPRSNLLLVKQRVGVAGQQRNVIQSIKSHSRHHSKSPCGNTSQTSSTLPNTTEARTSNLRVLRRRASKSPETSGGEDNYEEQTTHSSHAVRIRITQRMDAEHLFASYSFLGLSEIDDLIEKADDFEETIKVMEDRMQLLREIYKTYRGKLTRLERSHKNWMTKKKLQAKENRDVKNSADNGSTKDSNKIDCNKGDKNYEMRPRDSMKFEQQHLLARQHQADQDQQQHLAYQQLLQQQQAQQQFLQHQSLAQQQQQRVALQNSVQQENVQLQLAQRQHVASLQLQQQHQQQSVTLQQLIKQQQQMLAPPIKFEHQQQPVAQHQFVRQYQTAVDQQHFSQPQIIQQQFLQQQSLAQQQQNRPVQTNVQSQQLLVSAQHSQQLIKQQQHQSLLPSINFEQQQQQILQQQQIERQLQVNQEHQQNIAHQQQLIQQQQQFMQQQNLSQQQQHRSVAHQTPQLSQRQQVQQQHQTSTLQQLQQQQSVPLQQLIKQHQILSLPIEFDSKLMLEYLKCPKKYDCVISIFHAKVAQKSYGNEKRFFCPPPCVYLIGEGWKLRKARTEVLIPEEISQRLRNESDQCAMIAGTSQQPLYPSDGLSELCSFISIGGAAEPDKLMLDFSKGQDFSAAKSLFISDLDKRKYFSLKVNFFYDLANGYSVNDLGNFESQRIKVISKPAKRKQSIKTNDCKYLCISGGTKVALFNRLRSQNVSTRYLHTENGKFNANARKWGAFTIHLVDMQDDISQSDPNMAQFYAVEGYVSYGNVVKLIDSVTGLALPPMKIRKVEKNMVVLDSGQSEPVSQLHKCAFQMLDNEFAYLCLNNDSIVESTAQAQGAAFHTCSDGAAWTIISTEVTEYRFYEALSLTAKQVTPVPIINGMKLAASGTHVAHLYLEGCNFNLALTVWLGATPIETLVSSSQMIRCPLPPLSQLNRQSARPVTDPSSEPNSIEFPISLVRREDGLIYGTTAAVTYSYPRNVTATEPDADEFAVPTRGQLS